MLVTSVFLKARPMMASLDVSISSCAAHSMVPEGAERRAHRYQLESYVNQGNTQADMRLNAPQSTGQLQTRRTAVVHHIPQAVGNRTLSCCKKIVGTEGAAFLPIRQQAGGVQGSQLQENHQHEGNSTCMEGSCNLAT